MENTITVKLQFPIGSITELILHRVKGGDLQFFPDDLYNSEKNNNLKLMLPVIATLSNQPKEIVNQLDLLDITSITEAIQPFLVKSPQIGKNASGE